MDMKRVHEDKRYNKKSFQAISVAKEVIERVNRGEKVNLKEIQVRKGYSLSSAIAHKAVKTKSYQSLVLPVVSQLEEIRQKTLNALSKKDLDQEKYRDLIVGVDTLTKNTQLLSGKATENVSSNVIVYGSDDFLATQVKTSQ